MNTMRLATLLAILTTGCPAPAILTPQNDPDTCHLNEKACVGFDYKPNGTCCLATYACGGSFPNVGCPEGSCCPTQSGYVEAKEPIKARRLRAPEKKP